MAETSKQRGRLTLSDLKAIEVPNATSSRPAVVTPPSGAEAVPDTAPAYRLDEQPAPAIDASEHLPDGVSREVASILGMPSREEAARAAAKKAAEEKAAAEAREREEREAALRDERERAEAERVRAQAELAETQRAAAARLADEKKRFRTTVAVAGVAIAALVAAVLAFAVQGPELDTTPFAASPPGTSPVANAAGAVGFMEIPDPPVIEAPAAPAASSRGRSQRPAVRGTDLF